jgi:trimeric autotransporter adhesin
MNTSMTGMLPPRRNSQFSHWRLLVGVSLSAMALASEANALPSNGTVSGGSAQISTTASSLTVTQSSNRAVIDWQNFDIGNSESVNFQQPGSSAIALNRVNGGTASQIYGSLTANGNVWIVNPDGVVFGSTAQVNVGGLVATTSNMSNSQFMAGSNSFNLPGNPLASVVNQGSISVADSGLAALVAPSVQNSGTITARFGTIALASGDTFAIDTYGDGLIQLKASNQITQQLVQNSGTLNADGGRIHISAAAASQAVSSLINLSGLEQANTIGSRNGKITVYAAGKVNNSGTILANGTTGNGGHIRITAKGGYTDTSATLVSAQSVSGNGGSIHINAGGNASITASGTYLASGQVGGNISMNAGQNITLTGAKLFAEGQAGGGTINLGISKAAFQPGQIAIDAQSVLSVDTQSGPGGSINISAADITQNGTITAHNTQGSGGTINVSFTDQYQDSAIAMVTAASDTSLGGIIRINGGDDATLTASGSYVTDGGTTGGEIDMLSGNKVMLLGAFLSARGPLSGGLVRIGGDYLGTTGSRKAEDTEADDNTKILADATNNGDGGQITVSGTIINFAGLASAQGGPNGGNGGSITLFAPGSNAVAGNVATDKTGTATSLVQVTGTLETSGIGAGGMGGNISVMGDDVGILSGALVDASGDAGGGYIKIGGDIHGAGTTPTAVATVVQTGVTIDADAISNGNGGNVVVWSDNYTNFAGNITARGGAIGGDGGFIETSGKQVLNETGSVDASAPKGAAGTWLMDPYNVTIGTTDDGTVTGDNGSPTETFTPNATGNISHTTIETALNNGTNVIITTGGNGSPGADAGDITISSAISAISGTSGATGNLTLSAYRNILVNAPITLGSAGTVTGGTLTLNSDNGGNSSGYISVAAAISTNNGAITMGGGNGGITGSVMNTDGSVKTAASGYAVGISGAGIGINVNAVTVDAGSGTIIMNGKGFATGTNNDGVEVQAGGKIQTSGSIDISGIGGAGDNANIGVFVTGANSTIKTSGANSLIVVGVGNGTSNNNAGVWINVANGINAASTGSLMVNGTGTQSSATTGNDGIQVNAGSITGNGGTMTITGVGGTGTGGSFTAGNDGIYLLGASSAISNTSTGALTVTGTAKGNTTDDIGVYVSSATDAISTVDGPLSVTGYGSTTGTGVSDGVAVVGAIKATGNGSVSVTGTAAGTGANNVGVLLEATRNTLGITTAGTGSITVMGTGSQNASATTTNYGVALGAGNSSITANTGSVAGGGGNITITGIGGTGTGGATNTGNVGVGLATASNIISTTLGGTITITGTGNGTAINNYGVALFAATDKITSATGTISITGTGSTSGTATNYGVDIALGTVKSTGTGANITINGTGGAGTSNYGVNIGAANGVQTTGTGDITVITDTINLAQANDINSIGNLNVQQHTNGTTIGLGSATCGSSCGLSLSDTLLGYLTWGSGKTLTIGNANSGNIDVNTALTYTNPVYLVTGGNVILDGVFNSSYSGTAFVAAATGNFVNNVGSNPLNLTGTNPNWVIYSTQATSDTNGAGTTGLSPTYTTYSTTFAGTPPSSLSHPTSNNWVYSAAGGGGPTNEGTVDITATAASYTYGDLLGTLLFSCSGNATVCGSISTYLTGALGVTNESSSTISAGTVLSHTNGFDFSANPFAIIQNTLNWASGYSGTIDFTSASLTLAKKAIAATGFAVSGKTYDGTTSATISSNGSLSNGGSTSSDGEYITGDTVSIASGGTATFGSRNAGTETATGSLSLTGAQAGDYTITAPTANATVAKATLSVTADAENAAYGDTLGTLTYTYSGLGTGDSFTGALTSAAGNAGTVLDNANGVNVSGSPFAITKGTLGISDGNSGNNYNAISYTGANLTLAKKALTITANNQTTIYGTADTTLDAGYTVGSGLASGDTVSSASLSTTDSKSGSGNYDVTGGTAISVGSATGTGGFGSGNYAITYNPGTLTVSQLGLTISALTATNKPYDGNTADKLTGSPTIAGGDVLSGDTVSLYGTPVGTFARSFVGNNIAVALSGLSLMGGDAANYSITGAYGGLSANITGSALTTLPPTVQMANTNYHAIAPQLFDNAPETVLPLGDNLLAPKDRKDILDTFSSWICANAKMGSESTMHCTGK